MPLSVDYTNMIGSSVGGISTERWAAAHPQFLAAHEAFAELRRSGSVGFADLPGDGELLRATAEFASRVRGRYQDVVVLGIGGSALGPLALRTALRPSGWNMLPAHARDGYPRLHVLDNVDPVTIAALLARIEPARTLFIVTSKSGGTAETMAQYLVVDGMLGERGLTKAEHFVFVTDPEKGALRPLAQREGIPALPIPANVGGRFSVLTPVGTLPAALIGIDVANLLARAGDMAARCESGELSENPAGVYATLQWLADTSAGKRNHVFMPYSDPLRDFAAWFVQLWAESLGKVNAEGEHVGPTPVAALGATDQHSQVQLFMEGPADKTVTFVEVRQRGAEVEIPHAFGDVPDLAYLGGHSLSELIDVERRATAGALAARRRPNMTITLEAVDERNVGELIMLLELATAYAGQLYQVDAFNQPGVELGKQFAYAMLGRPGHERARAEWDRLPSSDARYVL